MERKELLLKDISPNRLMRLLEDGDEQEERDIILCDFSEKRQRKLVKRLGGWKALGEQGDWYISSWWSRITIRAGSCEDDFYVRVTLSPISGELQELLEAYSNLVTEEKMFWCTRNAEHAKLVYLKCRNRGFFNLKQFPNGVNVIFHRGG